MDRNNARNAMTPSVSAVTVIERQRQSTATLTPKTPSTATLVRKLIVNSVNVSLIFLYEGPHDSWEPCDEELQQRRDEQETSFCPEDRV